jgi:polyphosphate glucokinase
MARGASMNVLSIDIGGTNVKVRATGQPERRRFRSGPKLTPIQMVAKVKKVTADWQYDVVSVGYPGRVVGDRPTTEPRNLGPGWIGFDFAEAFGCPTKVINDAAMQGLGSYNGGTMLFLGFGTGLGSVLIVRGHIVPMELGALPHRKGTVEDYVGRGALEKYGKKKWRKTVEMLAARFSRALLLDDFVIGGGNAKKLKTAPPGCRLGTNANAFIGGFRMWAPATERLTVTSEQPVYEPTTNGRGAGL